MTPRPYDPQAEFQPGEDLQLHRWGCRCALHGRRLFTGALAAGTLAATLPAGAAEQAQREGVDVGGESWATRLVPAEQVEAAGVQEYGKLIAQARAQGALAPDNHPQVIRLRAIARALIPNAMPWNARSRQWPWEVNLIGSKQINAFCMPGGKIAFFTGILDQLKLTDDEVAMVMGHEAAHALREHARERMGKTAATRLGAGLISSILGLGNTGDTLLNIGSQLLTLRFSREDESEADLVGMEIAARTGYDPRAGVSLWQKMGQASKGAPPQFLSTHPSGSSRIQDIQANLPRVMPLYERAAKPARRFDRG
ncbi:MAG: M48 family metallopeptidase [Burkholderiales bacterium]|nr:M48 family metallopeptidase [Burkholderiales bacterium]